MYHKIICWYFENKQSNLGYRIWFDRRNEYLYNLSTFNILDLIFIYIDKDCQWPVTPPVPSSPSSCLTAPPTSWWHTECWPTRSRTLRCRGSGTWAHQSVRTVIYWILSRLVLTWRAPTWSWLPGRGGTSSSWGRRSPRSCHAARQLGPATIRDQCPD